MPLGDIYQPVATRRHAIDERFADSLEVGLRKVPDRVLDLLICEPTLYVLGDLDPIGSRQACQQAPVE